MSVPPGDGWPQAPGPNYGQPATGYSGASVPQQPLPGQQGPWPQQPGYPPPARPPKGNVLKWLLGGVVVVLAIALAVTTTLLLKDSGGGNASRTTAASSSAPSDVASANDVAPVSIITVEPTCSAWSPINNMVADAADKGWGNDRNNLGPASQWTPDQRAHVEAATEAMRRAADQMVPLAKQTPHRVVRELYEQLIAYWRAYADAIPTYTPPNDNYLADATVNLSETIRAMCSAITYGSAPLVTGLDPAPTPTAPSPPKDPGNPERFITDEDGVCQDWVSRQDAFAPKIREWAQIPFEKPGSEWTPEEVALNNAAFPVMSAYADANEKAGTASGNPVLEDFAVLSATYLRALVAVGLNYTQADGWFGTAALRLASVVSNACQAAGTK
jgi:hypothetical protein